MTRETSPALRASSSSQGSTDSTTEYSRLLLIGINTTTELANMKTVSLAEVFVLVKSFPRGFLAPQNCKHIRHIYMFAVTLWGEVKANILSKSTKSCCFCCLFAHSVAHSVVEFLSNTRYTEQERICGNMCETETHLRRERETHRRKMKGKAKKGVNSIPCRRKNIEDRSCETNNLKFLSNQQLLLQCMYILYLYFMKSAYLSNISIMNFSLFCCYIKFLDANYSLDHHLLARQSFKTIIICIRSCLPTSWGVDTSRDKTDRFRITYSLSGW